jgi:sulfatase maturation enzyme AslB (radical SAM superfamily)
MKDKFCVLPWVHLSADTDGTFSPCCLYQGTIKADDNKKHITEGVTVSEVWNSNYMQDLRTQFLNNKQPHECRYCWDLEDGGMKSKRINDLDRFYDPLATYEAVTDKKPVYFDLKLGSICNLKCRICTYENSTKWAKDAKALKLADEGLVDYYLANSRWAEDYPEFWQDLLQYTDDVVQIDFAGGDPLLIKEHYRFLEMLVKQTDVSNMAIHYNTNGTVLPSDHILNNVWPKFKCVEIMLSIDALEEKFEYQRHGAKWTTVVKNIARFRKFNNIVLQVCHTVNILNVLDICSFVVWAEDNCLEIYFNMLYHPAHYNIKNLPLVAKQALSERINSMLNAHTFKYESARRSLNEICDYVKTNGVAHELIAFSDITYKLDEFRNEDFRETFPELNKYLHGETEQDT